MCLSIKKKKIAEENIEFEGYGNHGLDFGLVLILSLTALTILSTRFLISLESETKIRKN